MYNLKATCYGLKLWIFTMDDELDLHLGESLWLWIIEATSGIKDYYVLWAMGIKDCV